jgi:hypothetical protein
MSSSISSSIVKFSRSNKLLKFWRLLNEIYCDWGLVLWANSHGLDRMLVDLPVVMRLLIILGLAN